MARPGGQPGFPYRPDGSRIGGGATRLGSKLLVTRINEVAMKLFPERMRNRFGTDQYDPVIDMALIAIATDDPELRLAASSRVAPYIHAVKKHVEIDDKRRPEVKDALIERLVNLNVSLAAGNNARNVTPEAPVDIPAQQVLEHEPRQKRPAVKP